MKTLAVLPAALLLLFAAPARPSLAAEGSGDCRAAAAEILRFARTAGVGRISVLEFTPKGGAEKSEAEYITEELSIHLAGAKKPVLIERAQLEKLLTEARLGVESLGGPGPEGIFSVDAVVTGSVFAAGEKLKVMVRLIDVRTGAVLKAAMAEADRDWPRLPEAPLSAEQFGSLPWPAPSPGFRDAVADKPGPSCEARKRRLAEQNEQLVDAKARYWAARMREPGFTISGLSRNPGTEISDPGTKARFYALLKDYHGAGGAQAPDQDKLASLTALMKEEDQVYNECGYR